MHDEAVEAALEGDDPEDLSLGDAGHVHPEDDL